MKKQCRPWLFALITGMAILGAIGFYSVRSMWSGIIAMLGDYSPYILMAVIILCAAAAATLLLTKKRPVLPAVLLAVVSLFYLGLEGYILSVASDSIKYFAREFFGCLLILAGLFAIIWLLMYYPKSRLAHSAIFKAIIITLAVAAVIIVGFNIVPNSFTTDPVVYAVGDEYQIVFMTSAKSTAWVEIGGREYNDTYAGSRTSETTVHKITVPMDELDSSSGYKIFARGMLLRGPYSALQGKTISADYAWRGVNTGDGLNYYVISDTHTMTKAPTAAASYFGESLDFLICCGDTANWLDRPADMAYCLKIFSGATGSAVPVVYARGNHETKGELADQLYRYVGANGTDFYYTFRLKNIWGVVLDMGEDHGDDWSEFFDSSRFDAYRSEQTAFLDKILANSAEEFDAPGVTYRIAICHIPLTFTYYNDHAAEFKSEWVARLDSMKLTALYGGHRHQLIYIDPAWEAGKPLTYYAAYAGKDGTRPDGYATGANFPSVLVSRKSNLQVTSAGDTAGDRYFFGLAVTADENTTTWRFTNSDKSVLEHILSPWLSGVDYGDSIVINNVK